MIMEHIKGTLILKQHGTHSYSVMSGDMVLTVCKRYDRPKQNRANAYRIVECWNACDGIEDPTQLRKQRDDLLAAAIKAQKQLNYLLRNVTDDTQIPYEVLVPLKEAIRIATE